MVARLKESASPNSPRSAVKEGSTVAADAIARGRVVGHYRLRPLCGRPIGASALESGSELPGVEDPRVGTTVSITVLVATEADEIQFP